MIDLAHRTLSQDKARTLLRKLRDRNLSAGPIAVGPRARVVLAGCLSTDAPAEGGVRYLVRLDDGSEGHLEIRSSTSYGIRAQSAVIASSEVTARNTIGYA